MISFLLIICVFVFSIFITILNMHQVTDFTVFFKTSYTIPSFVLLYIGMALGLIGCTLVILFKLEKITVFEDSKFKKFREKTKKDGNQEIAKPST